MELTRVTGALLGGAVGDALGAPVEFMDISLIRRTFGVDGISGYVEFGDHIGRITDDTQMTLFTAEGLLRAEVRARDVGIYEPVPLVYNAYQRWMITQGYLPLGDRQTINNGWLIREKVLFCSRAPGSSCLSALSTRFLGSVQKPINHSKGCGTVMRIAPVGLANSVNDPFELGMQISALTHGHPSGFLAGGALAQIIRDVAEGSELSAAVTAVCARLKTCPEHEETLQALQRALAMAKQVTAVTPEIINELGEGWIAEEALAISIFCALKYPDDFRAAVLAAVNISGDSDSTGSITGNLMGAILGEEAIPAEWITFLREEFVVRQIAMDLYSGVETNSGRDAVRPSAELLSSIVTEKWRDKYPGC